MEAIQKTNDKSRTGNAGYETAIRKHKIKDPGSAITHFIAMVMAAAATAPLIKRAGQSTGGSGVAAVTVFMASMILLYGASTSYHSFDISPKVNKVLKKIDHSMISVLIAGTYTPLCIIGLGDRLGYILLVAVWSVAALGVTFKICWVTCPKWVSSVMYVVMGWLCMFVAPFFIRNAGIQAFGWLLAGGILYTAGAVFYALKLSAFNEKHKNFGSHEIFHLFCMAGSFCHYMMVYLYLA